MITIFNPVVTMTLKLAANRKDADPFGAMYLPEGGQILTLRPIGRASDPVRYQALVFDFDTMCAEMRLLKPGQLVEVA